MAAAAAGAAAENPPAPWESGGGGGRGQGRGGRRSEGRKEGGDRGARGGGPGRARALAGPRSAPRRPSRGHAGAAGAASAGRRRQQVGPPALLPGPAVHARLHWLAPRRAAPRSSRCPLPRAGAAHPMAGHLPPAGMRQNGAWVPLGPPSRPVGRSAAKQGCPDFLRDARICVYTNVLFSRVCEVMGDEGVEEASSSWDVAALLAPGSGQQLTGLCGGCHRSRRLCGRGLVPAQAGDCAVVLPAPGV